jgi:type I restriction enzyme M protein
MKADNGSNQSLEVGTLENWLWEAACKIRGEIDAPKYKDYMLPIIFIKRLSDVFEDEFSHLASFYEGGKEQTEEILKADHYTVRFYLPPETRWPQLAARGSGVGQFLTDAARAIARENPKLSGVIDAVDFNASTSGQRVISDDKLKALIDVLGRFRLGLKDVEPDILGRAYEYLLRKFAEGSGQSAGEFYTPREVAVLMAHILDPQPGQEVYDPCAGSGGLLIKTHLRFQEKFQHDYGLAPLRFYGQENLASTYAMSKMNMFIHDMDADIRLGDTMNYPKFTQPNGALKIFDLVTANPMWNQDFSQEVYENDGYDRFEWGYPPSGTADWGWVQHMYRSLNEKGKMAVVLDTGAVSRGSGSSGKNRERDIRKIFVEQNLVEAVILLPENLFYNTTAPGIILVVNKQPRHQGILLINGSKLFKKGKPKNYLPEETIDKITSVYLEWREEPGTSKIISTAEVVKNDYNLSPSRYVSQEDNEEVLPLEEAVLQLHQAEEERKEADANLNEILNKLGL